MKPLWTIILLQLSYRHKVTIVLLQAIISLASHYHTVTRYHIVTSHHHTVTRYHIVTKHYHPVRIYHIVTVTVILCHFTSLLSYSGYCKLSRTALSGRKSLFNFRVLSGIRHFRHHCLPCPPHSRKHFRPRLRTGTLSINTCGRMSSLRPKLSHFLMRKTENKISEN